MKYRTRGNFEALIWLLLRALTWVGIAGIAWNLFKPGGWLYRCLALIEDHQPTSYYYAVAAIFGVFAAKHYLDQAHPNVFSNLLTVLWAFAGTFFILHALAF